MTNPLTPDEETIGRAKHLHGTDDRFPHCIVCRLFATLDTARADTAALVEALTAIRDCGPAHPAEDWNLPADRQITGADCQQAAFMRETAYTAIKEAPDD